MEKVKIDHGIDVKKLQQDILNKYKEDDFFLKNYQDIKKDNDNIDLSDLIEVVNSRRICDGCDGLSECSQNIKGHCLGLENNRLKHVACAYLQKQNKLNDKFSCLVYSTFTFTNELPDVKQLDMSIERAKIVEHINSMLNNETKKGLFLSGPPGVGKTFIIEALLNSYLTNERKCAYVLLNDLFTEMKAMYFSYDSDDKEMYGRIITRLKNVSVLIIDDIGAEKVDALSRDEILFPILDFRMKNEKRTHFTSNYTLAELEQHYAETSAKISEPIKSKRLIERIRVLSEMFVINEKKSRR